MNKKLFVALQHVAPQHLISRLAGVIANCEWVWVKDPFIRWFSKRYQINMDEAATPELDAYPSFNQFFTRELKAGARPIDDRTEALVSPADGVVSQCGPIKAGTLVQAKGRSFTVQQLLACDAEQAAKYADGQFATIYLSPSDYHRVHMPCDGTLKSMTYVPGKLFSVNQATAEGVPGLFARNERVVATFDTPWGELSMVLVGAMVVASIETVWAGVVAPLRRQVMATQYGDQPAITLKKGDEMGRFKLGSTVVLVSDNPHWMWDAEQELGEKVQMGSVLALLEQF
jgi:phosphatidylserine decarboxylase